MEEKGGAKIHTLSKRLLVGAVKILSRWDAQRFAELKEILHPVSSLGSGSPFATLNPTIDDIDCVPKSVRPVGSLICSCQLVLACNHIVNGRNATRPGCAPEPQRRLKCHHWVKWHQEGILQDVHSNGLATGSIVEIPAQIRVLLVHQWLIQNYCSLKPPTSLTLSQPNCHRTKTYCFYGNS